jgi:hypothetical protein
MSMQQHTIDLSPSPTPSPAPGDRVVRVNETQARVVPNQPGIVLPVILVGLGVVFLLNNLGLMAWDVWNAMISLWPLLLIAVGLDILIGRRSALGSLIVGLVLMIAIVTALWIWAVQPWGNWSGELVRGQQVSQSLEGATSADVTIDFSFGTLQLASLSGSNELITGTIDKRPNENVTTSFNSEGDTAYFALESRDARVFPFVGRNEERTWDLKLNPDVPTNLKVNTGAGNATMDLSELNLTGLDLNGGVGNTTLTLPRHGRLQTSVDAGVGNVTIIVPGSMAARVNIDQGLGHVSVLGTFDRDGDAYVSKGYDNSKDRIDLKVNGGIGGITIRQQDAERLP